MAAGLPAAAAAASESCLFLGLGARASLSGLSEEEADSLLACVRGGQAAADSDGAWAMSKHEGLQVAALWDDAGPMEEQIRSAAAAGKAPHLICARLGSVQRRSGVCAVLRQFKGALLLIEEADVGGDRSDDDAALLRSLGVTSRWRASQGGLGAFDLPAAPATEVLGDFRPKDLEADPALAALVADAQPLYDEHFHEDLLEDLGSKENARISFLVRPGQAEQVFCGLIVYKFWGPPLRVMSILRVAVPQKFRMLGYGRQLMRWAMQKATQMPRTQCAKLTLCAMPEAITFYDRLGFAPMPDESLEMPPEESDEVPKRLPGAVWMEYKCGRSYKATGKR